LDSSYTQKNVGSGNTNSIVVIDMVLTKLKAYYRGIFFGHRYSLIPKLLNNCKSILDLGCGRTSPLQFCKAQFSVGVDIFEPYVWESQKQRTHTNYVLSDITTIEFKPKSFDAVICTEVLEHLSKKEGYALVRKMQIWAKGKVIISTTNGYCEQGAVDNNERQIHKSGWTVDELERFGFKVKGIRGWIGLRTFYHSKSKLIRFIAERCSDVSQKITYYFPKMSHRLLGIYYVD